MKICMKIIKSSENLLPRFTAEVACLSRGGEMPHAAAALKKKGHSVVAK